MNDMSDAGRKQAEWRRRPERSNLPTLRLMSWISLRLGRPAGRAVLYGIALYFFLFAPASRVASRDYLRRVLPHPVRWRDLYRHIFWFASTIHDRIYLLNRRFDLFDIRVHGEEMLRESLATGRGVLLIGAHMGSFEVMRALGRQRIGAPVAMAMFEENARKMQQIFAAISPDAQQDVIALGNLDSMLKVSEYLQRGAMVGVLADRTLGGDGTQAVNFLGGTAQLPVGPFRMAALLRCPVVFMTGLYLGGNRYDIHFEGLADFSAAAGQRGPQRAQMISQTMERYAQLLESHCRRAPYNWFNFFNFWKQD